MRRVSTLVFVALLSPPLIFSECIPFDQARQHVGETRCITGRVVRIEQGMRGVHYIDFCEDYRLCPFTAVIFPSDLKSVGDVRQLQGRVVEIHGPVKEYDGRAETSARGSSAIRKLGTSRERSGSRRKCPLKCRRMRKIDDAEVLKADSSHALGTQARRRTARNDKMIKV